MDLSLLLYELHSKTHYRSKEGRKDRSDRKTKKTT